MRVRRILAGALVGGMVLAIPASAAFASSKGGDNGGEGINLGTTLLGSCENEPILKLIGGGDVLEVNLLGLGVKALDEGGVLTVNACDED